MKPYRAYVIGSNLYTYGDGHAHKTTCEIGDIVLSVATLDHVYLLDKHGMVLCGNVDKDGHVSLDPAEREVFDGPFMSMDAMTSKAYLLSASGDIYEVAGKRKIRLLHRGGYQKIVCGSKFLVALDANGCVSKYGAWFDGEHVERPTPFHSNVTDVVAGDFHCILLQENGDAVCYGEKEHLFETVHGVEKIYASGKSSLLTGQNFSKYYGGKHGK